MSSLYAPASLLDRLVQTPPRETSGSRSANRFSYQKNWALCLLLELHGTRDNYVLILDFHDDVIVLDSDNNPTGVEFYQIKTKTKGEMSLQYLLDKKEDNGLSILGKLFSNIAAFPDDTKSLNIVSTAPFGVTLAATSKKTDKTATLLSELSPNEIAKVMAALKEEHNLTTLPDIASIVWFIVSDLSLKDCDTHSRGKLSDFLQTTFPDKTFPVTTVYRTLISEIQRRNDWEQRPASVDDLLSVKAISKKQFETMLAAIPDNKNVDKAIADGISELRAENVSYQTVEAIRGAARQYEVERMEYSNQAIQKLRDDIIALLRSKKATRTAYPSLCAKMLDITTAINKDSSTVNLIGDDDYLKAMIIVEGWYV